MPSLYVCAHVPKQRLQAADETPDSTTSPGLVPWDRVQGPRQGSARQVQGVDRGPDGICEERYEGRSTNYPEFGLGFQV